MSFGRSVKALACFNSVFAIGITSEVLIHVYGLAQSSILAIALNTHVTQEEPLVVTTDRNLQIHPKKLSTVPHKELNVHKCVQSRDVIKSILDKIYSRK